MTRFTRSSLVLICALTAGGLLGACSSSSSSPAQTLPASIDLEVHAVSGLKFDQTNYSAAAGEISVGYVNEDSIRHNIVVVQDETMISGFELQVNKNGDIDSGSVTLEAGTYLLLCTVPGHQSMKAELTVS